MDVPDTKPVLVFTPATLTVPRGGQATYTVRLETQPAAANCVMGDHDGNAATDDEEVCASITIRSLAGLRVSSEGAARTSVYQRARWVYDTQVRLVFDTSNWNVPQTVTVDHDVADATASFAVAHVGTDASHDDTLWPGHTNLSDTVLADITDATLTVTIQGNQPHGVTISRSAMSVYELGTGNYTVALDAAPANDVTITYTPSGDHDRVTITPTGPLTFTATNWAQPQTMTIEAFADGDANRNGVADAGENGDDLDDEQFTITHAVASGDTNYGSIDDMELVVNVFDTTPVLESVYLDVESDPPSEPYNFLGPHDHDNDANTADEPDTITVVLQFYSASEQPVDIHVASGKNPPLLWIKVGETTTNRNMVFQPRKAGAVGEALHELRFSYDVQTADEADLDGIQLVSDIPLLLEDTGRNIEAELRFGEAGHRIAYNLNDTLKYYNGHHNSPRTDDNGVKYYGIEDAYLYTVKDAPDVEYFFLQEYTYADEGAGNIVIEVRITEAIGADFTAAYTLGTLDSQLDPVATKGTDYTRGTDYIEPTDRTVTIPEGQTRGFITIALVDDLIDEGDDEVIYQGDWSGESANRDRLESFSIRLSAATVTVTIPAAGGGASSTITVSRAIVSNGGAGHQTDWARGIIVDNDAPPTGFTLKVLNADGSDLTEIAEANTEVTASIKVVAEATSTVYTDEKIVAVTVAGAATGDAVDFNAVSTFNITIPANAVRGESAAFDFVMPADDNTDESHEIVEFSGSVDGETDIPVISDTLTLTDGDGEPSGLTLTVSPATLAEGDGATPITVSAAADSGNFAAQTVVTVTVAPGSATATTNDFTAAAMSITIAAGANTGSGTFNITATDDNLYEDDETLAVGGSAVSGSRTLVAHDVPITITDNDDPPTGITLRVLNADGSDLTEISDSTSAVTTSIKVRAEVTGDTRFGNAQVVTVTVTDDEDTGLNVQAPDVPSFNITIPADAESGETAAFDFVLPADARIGGTNRHDVATVVEFSGSVAASDIAVTSDTITLVDGGSYPSHITLTVTPDTLIEGNGATSVTVSLVADPGNFHLETKFLITIAPDGTTATEADFTGTAIPEMTIPAGANSGSVTFDVTAIEDTFREGNQILIIRADDGGGGVTSPPPTDTTFGRTITIEGRASITIIDYDPSIPEVSIQPSATALESDGGIEFEVRLTTRPSAGLTVNYATSDVTAEAGSDYTAVTDGSLVIANTATVGTITINLPANDSQDEGANETFQVTISLPTSSQSSARLGALSTANGIIIDDDPQNAITVGAIPTLTEDGNPATYRVTLSSPPSGQVVVTVASQDTAAVTVSPATLTFTTNATETVRFNNPVYGWAQGGRVSITPVSDADVDEEEVTLMHTAAGGGYDTVTASPTVRVIDDDLGITISPTQLEVPFEGRATYEVMLTQQPNTGTSVIVTATADGMAGAGLWDGTAPVAALSLTFMPGNSWAIPRTVTVTNDGEAYGTARISHAVTGTDDRYTGLTVASATVTTPEPPPEIEFASARFEATEGSPLNFEVTLTPAPTGTVTVPYAITDRTATSADYTGGATDRAVLTGDGTQTTFTIALPTTNDSESEGIEYLTMTLMASTGIRLGTRASADGIIVDDATDNANLPEKLVFRQGGEIVTSLAGTQGRTFTYLVHLGQKPASPGLVGIYIIENEDTVTLSSDFTTYVGGGSIADDDTPGRRHARHLLFDNGSSDGYGVTDWYMPKTVTVTTQQSTPATFAITHYEDLTSISFTDANNYEDFSIDLQVTLYEAEASITETATAAEGDGMIEFEVMLTAPPSTAVTVRYETADSDPVSAAADTDYTAVDGGTVEFAVGDTTATITITISDDNDVEPDETFLVNLTGVTGGATLGTPSTSTGTITDNDTAAPTPTLPEVSIEATATAREGEGTMNFEVTVSAPPTAVVTVTYETADSSPTVSATADADYTAITSTSLQIAVGATVATIAVTIADDSQAESPETFLLRLTAVTGGATLGTPSVATGTITDNEVGITIAPVAPSVTEGEAGTYTVRLNSQPTADVTIGIAAADATQAAVRIDEASLVFDDTNWNVARTVTVTALDDDDLMNETVTIVHAMSGNDALYAALDDVRVAVTVIDDDNAGLIFRPGVGGGEIETVQGERRITVDEDETSTYVVSLGAQPAADLSMDIAFAASSQGGATSDAEAGEGVRHEKATLQPTAFVFTATNWNEPRTVTIEALADKDAEDETLTIVHATTGGGNAGGTTTPLVMLIIDNAAPFLESVSLSEDSEAVSDDGTTATYGLGERILFELGFSKAVRVIGTPQLRIEVGDNARLADYMPPPEQEAEDGQQGSGSTKLLFAYVVKSDDMATEGIGIPDNPLEFEEGDAIVDAANEDVPAYVAGDEDDPIEENIPAERTRVDGSKDFLLQADAGDDQDVKEDSTVTLDGSESRSGDPDNVEYAWAFKGDEDEAPDWLNLVKADEAVATFTVPPSLLEPVELTFELTVTSSGVGGETDDDEVVVRVDADNDPPTAQASADPDTVDEGAMVTLTGTGRDPEGRTVTFAWSIDDDADQNFTLDTPNNDTTTFTAPTDLTQNVTLKLKFEVSDGVNKTSVTVDVIVRAVGLSEVLGESLSRMGRMMAASARDAVDTRLSLAAASSAWQGGLTLNGSRIDRTADSWLGGWLRLFDPGGADGVGGMPGAARAGGVCGGGARSAPLADCGHFTERAFAAQAVRLPSLTPWDDLPNITSFEYAPGLGMSNLGMPSGLLSDVSVWGRFDTRSFESEATEMLTLEGSMTAFYLGVDTRYNGRDVAGIALGLPSNTVDFTKGEVEGEVTLSMVNFLPYISWSPDDGSFNVWGMLGFGSGESEVTAKSRETQAADTSMTLFAGGGSTPLMTVGIQGLGDIFVTAKADAFSVSMSSDETTTLDEQSVSASQLRGVLEGRMGYAMSNTAFLEPLLEFGLRFDGGDGDTGMGLEMGLGAAFINTAMGLSADGRARFLVFHGGDGVAESGFSLQVLYDPGGAGGPGLSFTPVWGETASQSDALWRTQDITKLALDYKQGNHDPSGKNEPKRDWHPDRMDLSLHYGFERTGWMVTPYGALVTGNGNGQHARLGLRLEALNLGPGTARLNLFNERTNGPGLEASLQMPLR